MSTTSTPALSQMHSLASIFTLITIRVLSPSLWFVRLLVDTFLTPPNPVMACRVGAYIVGETIGQGRFGKVKIALHEQKGVQYAMVSC